MVNWIRTWIRLGEYAIVWNTTKIIGVAIGKRPRRLMKISKCLFFRFHALMPEEAYEDDEEYKDIVKEWASYK